MTVKRGLWFTPLKSIKCDRCGKTEKFRSGSMFPGWEGLCEDCYNIPQKEVRSGDYIHGSGLYNFKNRESLYLKCSLCGRSGEPEEFYHVCIKCHTEHPDSTHDGLWGYNANSDITEVSHCNYCSGICIKKKTYTVKLTGNIIKLVKKIPNHIAMNALKFLVNFERNKKIVFMIMSKFIHMFARNMKLRGYGKNMNIENMIFLNE